MKRLFLALVVCVVAQAHVVPAMAGLNEAQGTLLVRQFIDHHAVPRYNDLSLSVRRFQGALEDFCMNVDEAGLSRGRAGFKAAYLTWFSVQHIRFGPVMRDDVCFKLQFWPDKHGRAGRQLDGLLASKEPVPAPDVFDDMSVAVQGFPALERLLFDTDVSGFSGKVGHRRCALAVSMSVHLSVITERLVAEWRSYVPPDATEALEKAYRGYMDQLSVLTELKLRRPMGASLEGVRPKRSEAWRSGLSFAAIAMNLKAMGAVFDGEGEWPGFRSVLDDDPETVGLSQSLSEHFAYGAGMVGQRAQPLLDAVSSKAGR